MNNQNNQNDNLLKIYYPTVDQIYIETDNRLKNFKGWGEWKNDSNEIYLNVLKKYEPTDWSKEFFMIHIFYNHIENYTDLLIDTIPEKPEKPDDSEVTANDIKQFKTDFDNYLDNLKKWHWKLIDIAPRALEEFSNLEVDLKIVINPKIKFSGKDPLRYKNIAFSYEEKGDWDSAIEYQKQYYEAVNEYHENYPYDECDIYDLRRLPIYLYKGGYIEESWEEFRKLSAGEYPVKRSKLSTLESKILEITDLSLIYASMRNLCIKEKRYKDAFIYRCLDLYYSVCGIYFMSKIKDHNEFIFFISERFFEDWDRDKPNKSFRSVARTLRKDYAKNIKTRARMAKVQEVSQVVDILVDATKLLPKYESGKEWIIENIKSLSNNVIYPDCEKGKILKKEKKKFTDSDWEWNE